ncbi:thiol-disulfide oxidoreductase [Salinivirga cyanobacteriivorans]|uniref:Thiol-disulfide oxidoreductase n=1 Tax=Salinivirga cyanobacteriivorans TaxID=1307839 RepID=A0A0S2I1F4_9BACT|nr:thioredoxin-like domain-containing protein [Salinivirga cyanobacteriivorans]ALO16145.1 thiol-disulfide oxidoreductase [Salinivirga cyanobacteriivorans]
MEAILNLLFRKLFTGIISLCLVFAGVTNAQDTTILTGQRADWANKPVEVWYYADYISTVKETVAEVVPGDSGKIDIPFSIKEPRQIYVQSGGLEGSLFVMPGKTYALKLPEYRQMSKVDSLNPFYQPFKFFFGLENSHATELNHLITEFDLIYNDYLVNNFRQIRSKRQSSDVDTMVVFLDSLFKKGEQNAFFRGYKKYKIAKLLHIAYLHDDNYVVRDYYLDQPVLYTNPAYFDLFNKMFDNYIEYYATTADGQDIAFNVVRAKSYQRSMRTLANNLALRNDTLRELVFIKGLNDALYKNTFPKSSLYQTLDSVKLQTKIPRHRKIVERIIDKTKKLQAGYPPPAFRINMGDTLAFSYPQKSDRFILLNFINIESFAVQKILPQLKQLSEKHEDVLKIVTINVGSKFEHARKYFEMHQYNWLLLNGNKNTEVLEEYNVKAYPSYFLLNPEGKLALNPTPGPDGHFEYYFFKILKHRERERYRQGR